MRSNLPKIFFSITSFCLVQIYLSHYTRNMFIFNFIIFSPARDPHGVHFKLCKLFDFAREKEKANITIITRRTKKTNKENSIIRWQQKLLVYTLSFTYFSFSLLLLFLWYHNFYFLTVEFLCLCYRRFVFFLFQLIKFIEWHRIYSIKWMEKQQKPNGLAQK